MIKINVSALESEKLDVISFYKKQIEAFDNIRKTINKVQWADDNYDALVNSMNEIGAALADVIQTLTNGHEVYMISEMIPLANRYLRCEGSFPTI